MVAVTWNPGRNPAGVQSGFHVWLSPEVIRTMKLQSKSYSTGHKGNMDPEQNPAVMYSFHKRILLDWGNMNGGGTPLEMNFAKKKFVVGACSPPHLL